MLSKILFRNFLIGFFLVSTFSSCSLIRKINETEPLTKGELNRRLLVQEYTRLSGSKIEKAADSILGYSKDSEVRTFAYLWKIKSLQSYNNAAFQTSPDLALIDTWTLTKQFSDFARSDRGKTRYKNWQPLVQSVTTGNLRDFEEKAREVLPWERYRDYSQLVYRYAETHPLTNLRFTDQTLRKEYLEYKGLPDSSAIKTVGSLPQVVADWANRLQFNSQSSVKSLKWNTEKMIAEQGWDTIDLDYRLQQVDEQLNKMLGRLDDLPNKLQGSIDTLSTRASDIMSRVENDLDQTKAFVQGERMSIDSMVLRERLALDTIVAREREAALADLGGITERTLEQIDGILWKLMLILILLVVILIVSFYIMGYYMGRSGKKKLQPQQEKPPEGRSD
ncbi:hypothetical protein E7Z59_14050 [Robertkochia marina]|uniref:Chemotaxis protein n=1 Tax=Robertkochia marina TaxID=1227945 RepID=A0A4S3LX00_9FLAO|nr:hypothetical protein [Robertkochia marina]THD65708.1 hypothetical protein E7Z59_14050 [Robertkochia marina]TRZ46608.1 hypothetical protein D3A96_03300 [Robertkochia marina]